jgi:hypothetical protein
MKLQMDFERTWRQLWLLKVAKTIQDGRYWKKLICLRNREPTLHGKMRKSAFPRQTLIYARLLQWNCGRVLVQGCLHGACAYLVVAFSRPCGGQTGSSYGPIMPSIHAMPGFMSSDYKILKRKYPGADFEIIITFDWRIVYKIFFLAPSEVYWVSIAV